MSRSKIPALMALLVVYLAVSAQTKKLSDLPLRDKFTGTETVIANDSAGRSVKIDGSKIASKNYVDAKDANTLSQSKSYADGKVTDVSANLNRFASPQKTYPTLAAMQADMSPKAADGQAFAKGWMANIVTSPAGGANDQEFYYWENTGVAATNWKYGGKQCFVKPIPPEQDYENEYAIPAMTSNSTPAPYTAISNSDNLTYRAYMAFDRTRGIAGSDGWSVAGFVDGIGDAYVGIKGDMLIGIFRYGVRCRGRVSDAYPVGYPAEWTLEGRNGDTEEWTVVDSQKKQSFSAPYQLNVYELQDVVEYRQWRLHITKSTFNTQVWVGELELYKKGSVIEKDRDREKDRDIYLNGMGHWSDLNEWKKRWEIEVSPDILKVNNVELTDITGCFKKHYLTDASIDNAFPYAVSYGKKMILSYFSRANHMANSWSGQRVSRLSLDNGVSFTDMSVLPDGTCYTGAIRIPGTGRVVSCEVFLDRTGASGYYEKTRPLICDNINTLFDSNGATGFRACDFLALPDIVNPQANASSNIVYHDGVLYLCGYHNGQFTDINKSRSFLFKSTDLGETWQFVSYAPVLSGECSIVFGKNNRLVMCSRVNYGNNLSTENNWIFYSDDFGATWNMQRIPLNIHNPYMMYYNDTFICLGRIISANNHNLGMVAFNEDFAIKNAYILDKSEKQPSYGVAVHNMIDRIRVFSHTQYSSNNADVFYMDVPMSIFVNITN